MDDTWNPDSPGYRNTRDTIEKTFAESMPAARHDVLAGAVELGVKGGIAPTELRATFEQALKHSTREQPAGSRR